MKAIICESFQTPENLVVTDITDPLPEPHEVVLKVEATGLGYVDALTVAGLYQIKPELPFIPGNEIAGTVELLGSQVKHLRRGQRVLAMPARGGLAEKVCIPEGNCIVLPNSISSNAAASFLVNYCTAFHGLITLGAIKKKENILILGASGGVGMAAIDVAISQGANVYAAASSKEKRDACMLAGAKESIDYSQPQWRKELNAKLDGNTLDLVYDPVGGDYAEPALRSLSPDGRFLVVGFASGEIPKLPLNLTLLKRISIIGVNWGGYIAAKPRESRPVINSLIQWIRDGLLHPEAGEVYTLEDAGIAMKNMLDRKAIGKTIISLEEQP
ncbi:MAG: NADPH:quinone oxidoreductase family protein [Gammaproteobacteria bacterium]|nr:NADPH:quinone oxidoreductase family protein [Gammaproteobacteria bacterium]MBT5202274.1 NADPH:quinone oxidoreductase family protein [Gammaproteobacteria bacterium]MBT5602028.1 NADPH:quinone oxidoreductase family protein [Gammaproteobacteria bacterium]MBT6247343.1 NADPH:quinone oxidoreductase family protein [Gammaproteobacteria bacterium]